MRTTNREIRRATPEDFLELRKVWWQAQLDAEALEARVTDFQIVLENGRIVAALGLQHASRQGRIYAESFDDPVRAHELRALLWARIKTWANNLGLWRLWTSLPGDFWIQNGFHPAEASVQVPANFNSDQQATFQVLQLGPEPSPAAAAIAEIRTMQFSARHNRMELLFRKRMLLLWVPAIVILGKIVIACIFTYNAPHRSLPKAPVIHLNTGTNAPPKRPQPEPPNTIKV